MQKYDHLNPTVVGGGGVGEENYKYKGLGLVLIVSRLSDAAVGGSTKECSISEFIPPNSLLDTARPRETRKSQTK